MADTVKQELLKRIPSISDLLVNETVVGWLAVHPRPLVTDCLREATEDLRRQILDDTGGRCGMAHVTAQFVLRLAGAVLEDRTRPHLRAAINATGIILHTGLGRAVWPECVVDSMAADLKGYVTLAVDTHSGKRQGRDACIEYLMTELTGAQAATVVVNNAAATLIVLAALCGGKEVIVSQGQLIEIGGEFRLPDVMAQSGSKMVEVGATNRTHPRDYERAITDQTAAIFRAHPSNYRIVGFTEEVPIDQLAAMAHARGLIAIDNLGAGALVGLERFGLPHEPTVGESLAAGADVVLFSADKLIGASQGGIIVGRKDCIERIRRHPLARALRVDKSCLMALERTLALFRDPELLVREHPTYRMLATPPEELEARAARLVAAIAAAAANVRTETLAGAGYLGSGSLPMHELPSVLVAVAVAGLAPEQLAQRLRTDEACVFARIERGQVLLDVRTMTDAQAPLVAAALGRITR